MLISTTDCLFLSILESEIEMKPKSIFVNWMTNWRSLKLFEWKHMFKWKRETFLINDSFRFSIWVTVPILNWEASLLSKKGHPIIHWSECPPKASLWLEPQGKYFDFSASDCWKMQSPCFNYKVYSQISCQQKSLTIWQ